MNDPDTLTRFKSFVDTFGIDINGRGGISRYAEFTGFTKAIISMYYNGKEKIHPVHLRIMKLTEERNEAKSNERKIKNEIKRKGLKL